MRFMQMFKEKELFCMEKHKDNYGSRKDLVMYRIQASKSNLKSARILLEAEEYKSANNRDIMLFSML